MAKDEYLEEKIDYYLDKYEELAGKNPKEARAMLKEFSDERQKLYFHFIKNRNNFSYHQFRKYSHCLSHLHSIYIAAGFEISESPFDKK
ncbi:hypothetical protein ACFL1H_06070 [Nanoarchaeota archaeon]